jgi:hypothetical protein
LVRQVPFQRGVLDPAFVAEAKAAQLEINPTRGSEVEKFIDELYQTSQDAILAAPAAIARPSPWLFIIGA